MANLILKTKNSTKVCLVDGDAAVKEFIQHDLFINSMSQFDLQSRLQTTSNVTVNDYTEFISKQLLEWDSDSIVAIDNTLELLNTKKILRQMFFPEVIYIILTNGCDEDKAAYCRNMNLIVLPKCKLENSNSDIKKLTSGSDWNQTLIHELFHIWSRNNIELRDKLYASIGYYPTPSTINLPKEIANLKITNPDAPITNHYIKLKCIDTDGPVCLAPILFADKSYDTAVNKTFFDYLKTGFLLLNNDLTPTEKIYSYNDVVGLYDKIGQNTDYIIHPEEVLADNFVFLVLENYEVKSPLVLKNMENILC